MSANTTKAPLMRPLEPAGSVRAQHSQSPAALAQAQTQRDELLWAIEYAVRSFPIGDAAFFFLCNAFRRATGHEVGARA